MHSSLRLHRSLVSFFSVLDAFTDCLSAAPGQPVYFTDVTAQITIPDTLANLGSLIGASSADVLTFVNIDFNNASPAVFNVYPNGLWVNNTQIRSGQNITVTVPSTGVLGPVGPVIVGSAGQDVTVFIGDILAEVYLKSSSGSSLPGPLNISCPATPNGVMLGTLNVEGEPSTTALAPANGFKPDFPALPSNGEFGYYRVNYNCSIGTFDVPLDLIFGGFLLGSYPALSSFSFTNITAFLSLNEGIVSFIRSYYGATGFTSTVSSVGLSLTHATPAQGNALKAPITIDATLPASGDLVLTIPPSGSLTVGPFKADDAAGQYMFLALQDTSASISFKNGTSTVQTVPVHCQPYGVLDLYG